MIQSLHLNNFKNFRDATLSLGKLTLLVGTNASGKSNLRDAFRFLHGMARGYTLAEIIGEKWVEGGSLQWKGIRGGIREVSFRGAGTFRLETDLIAEQSKGRFGYSHAVTVDIPEAKKILKTRNLNRLHESGWLENAVTFIEGEVNGQAVSS